MAGYNVSGYAPILENLGIKRKQQPTTDSTYGFSSILGGLFKKNPQAQNPQDFGGFTLPSQGGGHLNSTQHINSDNI